MDPTGESAMAYAAPIAGVISQIDSPIPGPADVIAGAIIAGAWLWDNMPDEAPVVLSESNDSENSCDSEITEETIKRKKPGSDGAESEHIIEKQGNSTISKRHRVTKDGKVIHQHKDHTGKFGSHRRFPNKWIR